MWDLGDAVNVRVNASNVEFDEIETVIHRAAGAVTLDSMYFTDRREEYSVVIDAALAHLIQSEENIRTARDELDPTVIQQFNTDVLGLRHRTSVKSRWR